ncbi:MAG TPA: cyanophycinase [Herpetosiphonaceae bacterium]
MHNKPKGALIIIGGHEDKEGDQEILKEVARRARRASGRIVVVTVASQEPQELADEYRAVFSELGVKRVDVLDIRTRDDACDERNIEKLAGAPVVFFTGGDQLRITSQIGDSKVFRCMREIYLKGSTIVGTSAGAAAMPETMLNGGPSDESPRLSSLVMAPGLAFISGVVIDSHFAERGRIGRLLGVVAQNPRNLGIGIDEDTAIIVESNDCFRVIGSGAIYVLDGMDVSYSSLSEENRDSVISIDNVRLHVLSNGDHFDLTERRPLREAPKSDVAS